MFFVSIKQAWRIREHPPSGPQVSELLCPFGLGNQAFRGGLAARADFCFGSAVISGFKNRIQKTQNRNKGGKLPLAAPAPSPIQNTCFSQALIIGEKLTAGVPWA